MFKKLKDRQKDLFLILFILVFTAIIYLPLFKVPFMYDDYDFLFKWEDIHSLEHLNTLWTSLPFHHEGVFRPVRGFIYAFAFHFFKHDLFSYHLLEYSVYLSLVTLIYLVTKKLSGKKSLAFLTSFIFAVLPIHLDNVANLTGNFDTIGVVLFFISFLLFQHYLKKQKNKLLFLSLIFSFLAYLTYEITLILPFLLLLYSILKGKFLKLRIYSSYFLVFTAYFLLRASLGISFRGSFMDNLPLKLSIIIKGASNYLLNSILPVPMPTIDIVNYRGLLLLSMVKEQYIPEASPFDAYFFFSLTGIVLLIFLSLKKIRNGSLWGFGALWFFLSLIIPLSSVLQTSPWVKYFPPGKNPVNTTQLLWERYAVIASFGFCLVLAFFTLKLLTIKKPDPLFNYFRYLGLSALFLLFTYYAWLVPFNLSRWRDPRPVILKQIEREEGGAARHNDLGVYYASYSEFEKAIHEFKRAVGIDPKYKRARDNLKNLCLITLPAEKNYQELVRLCPGDL